MGDIVHLNVHTAYSLTKGACRIRALVERAKELGQSALAITDDGALYGAVAFFDACRELGVKPIIGCVVKLIEGMGTIEPYTLTLLCENEAGYKNMCRIISEQTSIGGRFVTDIERLSAHTEGIIALSGADSGEIARRLKENRNEDARLAAERYLGVFGNENFFLELSNHDTAEESGLCAGLRELSKITGIPTVPTNNVHYVKKDGSFAQRVLQCIGENKRLADPSPSALPTEEYYLKSYDEMRRFFTEEELSRTVEIARRCQFEFEFGNTKLPLFTQKGVFDNAAYFRRLCEKGALKRYGSITKTIRNRLEYEQGVIEKMGFVDYFLIVWDFVHYAKSQDIPVGPGRGSGAGSLCAYCMEITDIDPLRFELLFERFLNPERVSMPDFDIDFCTDRRGEVIEYVKRRYTPPHVAQIAAFDTLKARAALRDAGRVMNIPPRTVDEACKSVASFNTTLSAELQNGGLKELYASDADARRLIDTALQIEGFPRHTTIHAAGVVITREPVVEYVPLETEDGESKTQYTMTELERLGLLKMDFLGLRNLTMIKKTCELVRKNNPDFNINSTNDSDPEVYKMLSNGKTCGVFQFESAGMTSLLKRLKPASIEDLTAALSLYRPGPMASIPAYIENRHKNPDEIVYKHPLLKDILSVTYGCIVYQEQVMQICRVIGGYSYGRADLVRRAMSKKKHDVMERERSAFVYGTDSNVGAIANGVPENIANEIFDEMAGFASYAFNKSHAAAYSIVAFRTAYLRRYYYPEYMSVLLSENSFDKISWYITDMSKNNVKMLPPDINKSYADFTVEGGDIRFGLAAVKNLGRSFIDSVVEERKNSPFISAVDFAVRMADKDNNRRYFDALIRCGAFDGLPHNRRRLITSEEQILDFAFSESERAMSGQLDLFGDETTVFEIPDMNNFSKSELLKLEKEAIGIYISAHPADAYLSRASDDCVYIEDALTLNNGATVSVIALLSDAHGTTTKNGDPMSFLTLEDSTGELDAVVFPDVYGNIGRLKSDEVYELRGRINIRNERRSLNVSSARRADSIPERTHPRLYINFDSENDPRISQVTELLRGFPGIMPALFCFKDTRTVHKLNDIHGVKICPALSGKLRRIFGDENIIIK